MTHPTEQTPSSAAPERFAIHRDKSAGMNLRRIDLNLLVAFDALLEERSVTKAAARLYVGQSAASASLARLRELFDDPLLVRQGKRLVPTPVAESLIHPIKEVLAKILTLVDQRTGFDPAVDHRSFSIMASDYVSFVLLRHLLDCVAAQAPHIKLHIRPITDDYPAHIKQNKVDLIISPNDSLPEFGDLHRELLFTDRVVCVVDAGHPEIGNTLTAEQFARLPRLISNAGRRPSLAEQQLEKLGLRANSETVASLTLGIFLLRNTRLINLVPEHLARAFQQDLHLKILEPPIPLEPLKETMVWTPRTHNDPAHVWLRQRLRILATEHGLR